MSTPVLDHGYVNLVETLRQAPNAQWEIQQYANAVADLLTEKFPKTMGLYKNGI